jgi:TPP-dependent indolepyruvate ferredoxin oxidoreductase alpha subunit
MKHVGLSVAADPLHSAAYTGVGGGFLIVTADDPWMHSSQNEQDTKWYGLQSYVPVLEPSNPAEACKMAYGLPLLQARRRVGDKQEGDPAPAGGMNSAKW